MQTQPSCMECLGYNHCMELPGASVTTLDHRAVQWVPSRDCPAHDGPPMWWPTHWPNNTAGQGGPSLPRPCCARLLKNATKKLLVTEAECENVAKGWLRYAKDCCGWRRKRAEQTGASTSFTAAATSFTASQLPMNRRHLATIKTKRDVPVPPTL